MKIVQGPECRISKTEKTTKKKRSPVLSGYFRRRRFQCFSRPIRSVLGPPSQSHAATCTPADPSPSARSAPPRYNHPPGSLLPPSYYFSLSFFLFFIVFILFCYVFLSKKVCNPRNLLKGKKINQIIKENI